MPDSPQNSSSVPWFAELRNILLIMMAAFFLLFGMTVFLLYDYHQSHLELQLQADRVSANLLSLILEEHVLRLEKTLESYAQRPLLLKAAKSRNAQKAREHLVNLTRNNSDIDSVVLADRQGNIWSTYPEYPNIIGKNFAHRDWYKGISRDWKPYASEAVMRVVAERDLAVQIGVPLLDEKAAVTGILLSSQRAVELSRIIDRFKFSNGATVNVTDRKGNLLYSSAFDCTRKITPFPFNDVVAKKTGQSDRTLTVHDLQSGGRKLYLSFCPVAGLGWHIVVSRDSRAILLAEIIPLLRITTIDVMFFIVIVLSLIYSRKKFMMQQVLARLQEAETLQKSEARIRAILDATPFPIAIVDLQDNNIAFWSYSALTLFGHTAPTAAEWYRIAYPDPDYRQEVLDRWKPFLEIARESHQPVNTGVYRIACRDGSVRLCELYATFLEDNLIVTFNDITERQRAEEEIIHLNADLEQRVVARTLQLEAINWELEAFSYSVSHDLRAPLRGIDGFSQALLEDYPNQPLDETGMNYLKRIRMATQRMGELIDDMLKLSRVSRCELQWQSVDLSHIVREIIDQLQQGAPLRVVDVNIQEGVVVQGDHNLMQVAIANMLDNAWKFSGQKEQSRIEFGARDEDKQTTFFVRDNGVGFDMHYVSKLFLPFQRLHTTEEFPGTGIGLVIVRRIIERHGGQVWAEGETGKGATVYFSLPHRGECRP